MKSSPDVEHVGGFLKQGPVVAPQYSTAPLETGPETGP